MHGDILHLFRAQLHHTRPSVSCGTAGHHSHGVWLHTPHTHLVFSYDYSVLSVRAACPVSLTVSPVYGPSVLSVWAACPCIADWSVQHMVLLSYRCELPAESGLLSLIILACYLLSRCLCADKVTHPPCQYPPMWLYCSVQQTSPYHHVYTVFIASQNRVGLSW